MTHRKGTHLRGTDRERLARHAADLYEAGHSIGSIAERIGRSYGSTRRLLVEAGVALRPRGGGPTRPADA